MEVRTRIERNQEQENAGSNPYNALGGVRQSHAINIGNPII